jgi:hypothetical protein
VTLSIFLFKKTKVPKTKAKKTKDLERRKYGIKIKIKNYTSKATGIIAHYLCDYILQK